MRFGFQGRFGSQVRFSSRDLPVHAVRRFTRFGQWWQKLSRSIKTETVTKIVPVGAVDLSIGQFCAEFRCELFRDDNIFWDRGQLLGSETEKQKWSRKSSPWELWTSRSDHSAQNFGANVFVTTTFFGIGVRKWARKSAGHFC